MPSSTIPIRYSIAELLAVALIDVAEDMEGAIDANAFLSSLAMNHRIWLLLEDLVESEGLCVEPSNIDTAIRLSSDFSRGISDLKVAAISALNWTIAVELAPRCSLQAIRERIEMAYRESDCRCDFQEWLVEGISKKRRLPN